MYATRQLPQSCFKGMLLPSHKEQPLFMAIPVKLSHCRLNLISNELHYKLSVLIILSSVQPHGKA